MIKSTYVWNEVRSKLVDSLVSTPLNVEVKASYDDKAKKNQIVIDSPDISSEDGVFSDSFVGEETINLVVDVYADTPFKKDELCDLVKAVLADDDISGITLIAITDVDNTELVNTNKYHSKSVTFTYLVDGEGDES